MKPIEEVFALWVRVELQITHGVPFVGKKSHLLIGLHTLALQKLKLWLGIKYITRADRMFYFRSALLH